MQIELGNGYLLQDWETAWFNGNQERFIPLADDDEVWMNLSDRFSHPYTRAHAENWVSLHAGVVPVVDFAVCDACGPIGGIGFHTRTDELRHSAAIGYWLGKPFWGRSIMTNAVKAMTAYGFETLGLVRIDARVYKGNEASTRVLEKGRIHARRTAPQSHIEAERTNRPLPVRHFAGGMMVGTTGRWGTARRG